EGQHGAEGVAIGGDVAGQGHLVGGADQRRGRGQVPVELLVVVVTVVHSSSEWSRRRISSTRSPVLIAGSSRKTRCGVYFILTWRLITDWRCGVTDLRAPAVSCSSSSGTPPSGVSTEYQTVAWRRPGETSTPVTVRKPRLGSDSRS